MVVICGVAGVGKTTVGQLLARDLGWQFYDADDFHSPASLDKMHSGQALTDEDRQPWLEKLRALIEQTLEQNAVLACSALKKKYRNQLRVSDKVRFVFLRGDITTISAQLQKRRGHFMDPHLLSSQIADLEEPADEEHVLIVEIGRSPSEIVSEIKRGLQLPSAQSYKP